MIWTTSVEQKVIVMTRTQDPTTTPPRLHPNAFCPFLRLRCLCLASMFVYSRSRKCFRESLVHSVGLSWIDKLCSL